MQLEISSSARRQVIDITDEVQALVERSARLAVIACMHTTCALTTADLDPGTDQDLLDAIEALIPRLKFRHPHDNSHAHVLAHLASSLIGPSLALPVKAGRLQLGSWQRLILVELDGPRPRQLTITNL